MRCNNELHMRCTQMLCLLHAALQQLLLQGIMGVIDGVCPTDYETVDDKKKRHEFLRMIGYKR